MLINDMFINETNCVKEALKKLNKTAEKVLLVVDKEDKFLGTITDGDIRRFILKGGGLENYIAEIYNKKPSYLRKGKFSMEKVKNILIKDKIELIPILDRNNRAVDFVTWSQVFSSTDISSIATSRIETPVVIMAGGKSTRLEPFTKIFPKPLIPIGDKPMIEVIIDEFRKQGASKFSLITNYKGEMIEYYFKNTNKDYEVSCLREDSFGGTAGGLKLLGNEIDDVFIVSNCDVIVRANFEEVIELHREREASLTVLSSFQHYRIPYGIVKFEKEGKVIDILEKPEYTFTVNAGVYVLNKECLSFIPDRTYFDMTELAKKLIENGKKVVTYPVNEDDYIDIGQWEEYKKSVEKLRVL